MADKNKTVLINIELDYKRAFQGVVDVEKELMKLKQAQADLNQAYKSGKITQDEYVKAVENVKLNIKNLNDVKKGYTYEIAQSIKREQEEIGSLKGLRAELKILQQTYDGLSKVDREGAIGADILQNIQRLTKELNEAEQASGRFGRNVGNYTKSIEEALAGTKPMKSAVKEIREELTKLNLQFDAMPDRIAEATAKMNSFSVGTAEYNNAEKEVENLKQTYKELGDQIQTVQTQSEALLDAIDKTANQTRILADGEKDLRAVQQSGQLLLDGYTALQAGMVALGIESENLMNIFAKLQILQQGLNSVMAISNALQDDAEIRVVLSNKLSKARNTYQEIYNGLLAKNTIITKTNNKALQVASLTATKLTAGIKTVGVAIKSIPVVGWILGAVAALGSLTALIAKHNREEKQINAAMRERNRLTTDINSLRKEEAESVHNQLASMDLLLNKLKNVEKGSETYNTTIDEIAEGLGVHNEWLTKNIDKVDELAEAWRNVQITQAISESIAKEYAELMTQLKMLPETVADIYQEVGGKKGDFAKRLSEEFLIDKSEAKRIFEYADDYFGAAENVPTGDLRRLFENSLLGVEETIKSRLERIKTLYVDASEDMSAAMAGFDSFGATPADKGGSESGFVFENELNALTNYGKTLKQEIAEVEKTFSDYVKKMDDYRKKDLLSQENYDKLYAAALANKNSEIEKLQNDAFGDLADGVQAVRVRFEYETNEEEIVDNYTKQILEKKNDYIKFLQETQAEIEAQKRILETNAENLTDEQRTAIELTILDLEGRLAAELKNMFIYDGSVDQKVREFATKVQEGLMKEFSKDNPFQTESLKAVRWEMENVQNQIENLTRIKEEGSEIERRIAKLRDEDAIGNIDTINQLQQELVKMGYTSEEALDEQIDNLKVKLDKLIDDERKAFLTVVSDVLNATNTAIGGILGMLETIGEGNSKMAKFTAALAYTQIGVNLAAGLAEAVKSGAGAPFPANLAAIATGIAAVTAAISAAFSTYEKYNKEVSAPQFADGGLIGGRTVVGRKGRADDVQIWASNGEFIVNAESTRKYLRELILINNGIYRNNSNRFSDGGYISSKTLNKVRSDEYNMKETEQMFERVISKVQPVVSVQEITKKQSRVKVKERISKQ